MDDLGEIYRVRQRLEHAREIGDKIGIAGLERQLDQMIERRKATMANWQAAQQREVGRK